MACICVCARVFRGVAEGLYFMYLLWRNTYLNSLPSFNRVIFLYYWVVLFLYICWIRDPYQIYDLQIFSATLWLSFCFLVSVLKNIKVFNFDTVQYICLLILLKSWKEWSQSHGSYLAPSLPWWFTMLILSGLHSSHCPLPPIDCSKGMPEGHSLRKNEGVFNYIKHVVWKTF